MEAIPQSSTWAATARGSQVDPVEIELLGGLVSPRKYINPKFFYDERGSQLFDEITVLPEYYPTRTEISILRQNASAIAERVAPNPVLIEPGAGSCEKVRYLFDSLRPAAYVPQDISADFLYQTVRDLNKRYPWLNVYPVAGDFAGGIDLPEGLPSGRRVVFYPGSTIGNFDPPMAVDFLRRMRELVGRDGGLLIGVDLQKDPAILNAAYNDSAGVTAKFNLNVLEHANRILGSNLNPNKFFHRAFYNEKECRIEMHLVSRERQRVNCQGACLFFAEGETIHTESSYKYTVEGFAKLARQAGFYLVKTWVDKDELFSVNYLE